MGSSIFQARDSKQLNAKINEVVGKINTMAANHALSKEALLKLDRALENTNRLTLDSNEKVTNLTAAFPFSPPPVPADI